MFRIYFNWEIQSDKMGAGNRHSPMFLLKRSLLPRLNESGYWTIHLVLLAQINKPSFYGLFQQVINTETFTRPNPKVHEILPVGNMSPRHSFPTEVNGAPWNLNAAFTHAASMTIQFGDFWYSPHSSKWLFVFFSVEDIAL